MGRWPTTPRGARQPVAAVRRGALTVAMNRLDAGAVRVGATCLASADGATVCNLAEWAGTAAHRRARTPADIGQGRSFEDSAACRATRAVPSISAKHGVRRYALVGTAEAGDE